ncbi:hypothetical protein WM016_08755 [Bifidobacterium mongoliense]|uniref:hypothetical protein n=1 Tax=Bifidobacterium mongoliense TaxID=518643 RepID=UPI0030EDF879
MKSKKISALILGLIATLTMIFVPGTAQAAEPVNAATTVTQPTFTAQRIDGEVRVKLNNARFVANKDGSVSVTSLTGEPLDVLPTSYEGHGLSYRMLSKSEVIAQPEGAPLITTRNGGRYATRNGGRYANCIAKGAFGAGVTGAIGGAIAGGGIPGATLGAIGGIVGGLVWKPFDCWGK